MYGSNFGSTAATLMDPFFSGIVAGGLSLDTAFASSSFGSGMHPRLQPMEEDDDNMPFAVDSLLVGNANHESLTLGASASGSSTMIIRDMMQPPKRLQLFNNNNGSMLSAGMGGESMGDGVVENNDDDIASQLADFKSFGASLLMAGSNTT
jgi:hypothetical protein